MNNPPNLLKWSFGNQTREITMTTKFNSFKKSAKTLSIACLVGSAAIISSQVIAAQDGPYASLNASLSIGPSAVSVAKDKFGAGTTLASGGPNAIFGLANDGRFGFDGSLGYIKNNFGVEVRYISLGSQKQISTNTSALAANETGTFAGRYVGLNGKYFLPVNNGQQDFHFSLGGGQLSTELKATNSTVFSPQASKNVTQNEFALLLGAGVRFNINKNVGINLEVQRITPVTHGLFNSGVYNNAYTVISTGLAFTY